MPNHQDRRAPLPADYQFPTHGIDCDCVSCVSIVMARWSGRFIRHFDIVAENMAVLQRHIMTATLRPELFRPSGDATGEP